MKTLEELKADLVRAEARADKIWDSAWTEIKRIKNEIAKLEQDNELERLEDELAEAYARASDWADRIWDSALTEIKRIKAEIKKLEILGQDNE